MFAYWVVISPQIDISFPEAVGCPSRTVRATTAAMGPMAAHRGAWGARTDRATAATAVGPSRGEGGKGGGVGDGVEGGGAIKCYQR